MATAAELFRRRMDRTNTNQFGRISAAIDPVTDFDRENRLFGSPFEPLDNAPAGGARVVFPDGRTVVQGAPLRNIQVDRIWRAREKKTDLGRSAFTEVGIREGGRPDPADIDARMSGLLFNPNIEATERKRKNLGAIAAQARKDTEERRDAIAAGKIPTSKERAQINLRYDELKKVPGTSVEQKQNLTREQFAVRVGLTTPRMDEVERVKSENLFADIGVDDPASIKAIRSINPRVFADYNRAAKAFAGATEEDAQSFRREYERSRDEVTRVLQSQGASLAKKADLERRVKEVALDRERRLLAGTVARTTVQAEKMYRTRQQDEKRAKEFERSAGQRDRALDQADERIRDAKEKGEKADIKVAVDAAVDIVTEQITDLDKRADDIRSLIAKAQAIVQKQTARAERHFGDDEKIVKPDAEISRGFTNLDDVNEAHRERDVAQDQIDRQKVLLSGIESEKNLKLGRKAELSGVKGTSMTPSQVIIDGDGKRAEQKAAIAKPTDVFGVPVSDTDKRAWSDKWKQDHPSGTKEEHRGAFDNMFPPERQK